MKSIPGLSKVADFIEQKELEREQRKKEKEKKKKKRS